MQRRSVLALIPMAAAVLALAACALPAFNKQADAEAKELFAQIADGKDLSDNTNLSRISRIATIVKPSAPSRISCPTPRRRRPRIPGVDFNSSNGATRAVLSHTFTPMVTAR